MVIVIMSELVMIKNTTMTITTMTTTIITTTRNNKGVTFLLDVRKISSFAAAGIDREIVH